MRWGLLRHVALAMSLWSFSPMQVNAQTTVGLRAGFNVTTFGAGPAGASYGDQTGLYLAGFVDLPLDRSLGVHLGAGYSGKGGESSSGPIVSETHVGYLELPALLTYRFFPGGRWSGRFVLGPTLSIKASCSVRTRAPGVSHELDCDEASLDVKRLDLGATAGVGGRLDLSRGLAVVGDVLYTHGLRRLPDSNEGVKNRAFTYSLGMAFPIGRSEQTRGR